MKSVFAQLKRLTLFVPAVNRLYLHARALSKANKELKQTVKDLKRANREISSTTSNLRNELSGKLEVSLQSAVCTVVCTARGVQATPSAASAAEQVSTKDNSAFGLGIQTKSVLGKQHRPLRPLVYCPSVRPSFFRGLQDALQPVQVEHVDGTKAHSFSHLEVASSSGRWTRHRHHCEWTTGRPKRQTWRR